jgi:transcriptional regulator
VTEKRPRGSGRPWLSGVTEIILQNNGVGQVRAAYDRLYGGKTDQAALHLLQTSDHGVLSLWNGTEGRPMMVFMHYVARPGERRILGHLANSNPALELLKENAGATFWVDGPSAYIPSYWVDPEKGVPTSYYSWAQFETEVELVRDPEGIAAILAEMLAVLQPEGRHPPLDLREKYWLGLVGAITGLDMTITACESRHKYGQNRSEEVRRNVVRQLRSRGERGDLAVAERVLAHLDAGDAPKEAGGSA